MLDPYTAATETETPVGLDMYLYAEKSLDPMPFAHLVPTPRPVHDDRCWDDDGHRYLGAWDWGPAEEREIAQAVTAAVGLAPATGSPHHLVCPHAVATCAAYWRKANAVHGWFVRELAGGKDECQRIDIPLPALAALVQTCRRALATREPLLLPESGFFFGSAEIDEYYWTDLAETVSMLSPLGEFPGPLYYRASW